MEQVSIYLSTIKFPYKYLKLNLFFQRIPCAGDQFDNDNSNIVQLVAMLKKGEKDQQLVYYQVCFSLLFINTFIRILYYLFCQYIFIIGRYHFTKMQLLCLSFLGWHWNVYNSTNCHARILQNLKDS